MRSNRRRQSPSGCLGRRAEELAKTPLPPYAARSTDWCWCGLAEGLALGIAYALTGLHHVVLLTLATGVLATIPFGAPLIFVGCALFLLAASKTTAAIALVVFGTLVVLVRRPSGAAAADRQHKHGCPSCGCCSAFSAGSEETFGLLGLFLGPAITQFCSPSGARRRLEKPAA